MLSGEATGPVCFSLSPSRRPEATMLNPNIWSSNGTGDGIAPGSTELVVVGGMHVERDVESGIEWLRGSLDGK